MQKYCCSQIQTDEQTQFNDFFINRITYAPVHRGLCLYNDNQSIYKMQV